MDVLTQGIIGAAAGHLVSGKRLPRTAWLIGAVAGWAPDLDVIFRAPLDPRPWMLHHRGVSHSLLFIPIGAMLITIVFTMFPKLRRDEGYWWVFWAALAGMATHAPLDALTSYGTQLWLPFSDARVSLDLIGIIDPFFTLPLLVGVVWGVWRGRRKPTAWALGLVMAYALVGGGLQHWRASTVQENLAMRRGHEIVRGRVLPLPLSLVVWRSVYLTKDGRVVVDRIRQPWLAESGVRRGDGTGRRVIESAQAFLPDGEFERDATRDTYEVFEWFADGYVVEDPEKPGRLHDARFGLANDPATALWGVDLVDDATITERARQNGAAMENRDELPRLQWWSIETRGSFAGDLWDAMLGRDPLYRPLDEIN